MIITGATISNMTVIDQPVTGLYSFTNFTFTTATLVGPTSGNLAQFKANYSNTGNTWIDSTSYYNITTPGYQRWTVPSTAVYEIEVAGSRAGISAYSGNVQANISHGKGGYCQRKICINTRSTVDYCSRTAWC